MKTIDDAVRAGAALLREAGLDRPRHEAVILLAGALGETKERVYSRLNDPLPPDRARRFDEMVHRRCRGVPVAYILGSKEFYGRLFLTDPRALIPRPDTELLVEEAIRLALQAEREPLRIHDCCTGTGCAAISIAAELREHGFSRVEVSGSDISAAAVALARENGERLAPGLVRFFVADLLEPPGAGALGAFDIITANPPYLTPEETYAALAKGWGEPHLALDGGVAGTEVIRRVIDSALASLRRNGYILIEAADHQAEAVRALLGEAGFTAIGTRRDLAGRERVTVGRYDKDNR